MEQHKLLSFKSKKGELLIRDIVFMMLIVSSILVFASTFVTEMAGNYANTDMEDEYALKSIAIDESSGLYASLKTNILTGGSTVSGNESQGTGLFSLAKGGLTLVTNIIGVFLSAPYDLGNLVGDALIDIGVTSAIAGTIKWTIILGVWIVIIFAIITAFLQGAKI